MPSMISRRAASTSSRLLTYGGAILFLAFGIGGFRYVWRYLLLGASRRIEKALRDRLFLHLQTLSISYFARTKVGDLMAHATNDIEAVRMSIGLGLVFLVDTVILGILTILFMIYIHPLLTLYAILPMPLITAVTLFFSRLIHQRFETLQRTFSALTERVRESISGIRVVKAYVLEEKEREKLGDLSQDYVQKNIHVTKIWGMFFPLLLFLSNFSMVIVLYSGGRLTIFQSISTGDFVAFMSYLGNPCLAHDGPRLGCQHDTKGGSLPGSVEPDTERDSRNSGWPGGQSPPCQQKGRSRSKV